MPESRDIEVGKQYRHPRPGNGSINVFPLQLIARNKISMIPNNENTFPLQRTETELLDFEATLVKAELKTKENPWTRCSRTSPEDLLNRVDFDSRRNRSSKQ
jgi:hypothetical protein